MILEIGKAFGEDRYRDFGRVSESFRKTNEGTLIPEGTVCKVTVSNKSIYLILRGLAGSLDEKRELILLDERSRNQLALNVHERVYFNFKQVGWIGQFLWAWKASDPAYRISARLGLLSVMLGCLGVFLGIVSYFK